MARYFRRDWREVVAMPEWYRDVLIDELLRELHGGEGQD